MFQRKIFIKRKKKFNNLYFFLFIIIIFLILIVFLNKKNNFFIISEFNGSFYTIPHDKGGIKVMNLDKKVLHLNETNKTKKIINNDQVLQFSIQFFTSNDYNLVKSKLDFITTNNYEIYNSQKKILNKKDFFVVIFNHKLEKEYLLLYKNFVSRELAFDYCIQYLNFQKKCVIVNVNNIN